MGRVEEGTPDRSIPRRTWIGVLAGFGVSLLSTPLQAQRRLRELVERSADRVPWDERFEVAIHFQIGDPRSASGRRPYVAVFIEDASGKPVRTVSLWAQKQIAWIRHLRHWFRGETARQAESGGNLISTLTSATRRPGEYTVVWDGKNDAGRLVEQGDYHVCIESVRQNASNHLVRQRMTFGSTPFTQALEDYADISRARVEMRLRK